MTAFISAIPFSDLLHTDTAFIIVIYDKNGKQPVSNKSGTNDDENKYKLFFYTLSHRNSCLTESSPSRDATTNFVTKMRRAVYQNIMNLGLWNYMLIC